MGIRETHSAQQAHIFCLIKRLPVKGRTLNISERHIDNQRLPAGGNLAASNIRNLECPSYEVYLIDYGCGKFNKKVHIME